MPAFKDSKTGKWFAKFYYTDWIGDRKQKWKRGFATKKEAQAFERDFLERQAGSPDMTFQSLYEIYIEDMSGRLKESTLAHKRNIYETKILPYFKNKPINEIQATDIRKWQTMLMRDSHNYKDTYLKSINNQFSCIMNYAKRFYNLTTDPCGRAGSMGKSNADEMDFWTLDEYLLFRESIQDKPASYLCFEVLYWTGMREGEMLALTASDIDFEKKTISINKTFSRNKGKDVITVPKTKKSKRVVAMPDFLAEELQDFINRQYMLDPKRRLFPYTKSFLSHEMLRGCKDSGVKKIRIHDLRHSHASLLINQGFDALTIAERLEHEKVSTTLNTYSHLFPHKQGELVQNLQDLLNPKSAMQTNELQTTNAEETSGKIIPMPIRHII